MGLIVLAVAGLFVYVGSWHSEQGNDKAAWFFYLLGSFVLYIMYLLFG